MAQSIDSMEEGVTQFSSYFSTSYRYVISLEGEKVNIRLEDRSSKKQWQTGMLKNEEFVTAGNVFDARDYVACFGQCLNCPLDNKKGVQRTLTPLPSGKLKLELGLRIRLFGASRSIKFVFELQPIAVDRVDVLESKLKDMKEELDKLSRRVDAGRRDDRYEESARWASRGGFIESFNAQGVSNRADRRRALDT
ncbi:hypothetical protein PF010_g25316 [Phytophthora fragariae]|uniref:Uncharacterized protein n=1 Tax=Phytophthora fragariae TaxID=53985 RepID=A0A6A3HNN6_9STRA|nr:hypothetical protein PF011_g26791 [Phytophthora fragariae]KAE9072857.1 hypothetical protein PF010_g25316 [Phytophthora fragariae]KAE9178388.1 hypothetical protein PF004_g25502 [Phytophthora fragariae]KAE9234412.1 hypothetical protein PF002_g11814 [Phytophthora fragariae]KAE9299574.1 hypothetical protein PF001_g15378 [Phytophthora fragariae]